MIMNPIRSAVYECSSSLLLCSSNAQGVSECFYSFGCECVQSSGPYRVAGVVIDYDYLLDMSDNLIAIVY